MVERTCKLNFLFVSYDKSKRTQYVRSKKKCAGHVRVVLHAESVNQFSGRLFILILLTALKFLACCKSVSMAAS